MTCIGEPISWLRLERHAAAPDPAVADHVAACEACRACLTAITGDAVALPPLATIADPRRARRWWWLVVPTLAAAAIAVVIVRPSEVARQEVAWVKGVGEVVLGTVRERAGVVRQDARGFLPGDRWKVVVTCPPAARAVVDVAVIEDGRPQADHPLAPAELACGNRVVVPGAFELTGTRPHRVCIQVAAVGARPDATACVELRPE